MPGKSEFLCPLIMHVQLTTHVPSSDSHTIRLAPDRSERNHCVTQVVSVFAQVYFEDWCFLWEVTCVALPYKAYSCGLTSFSFVPR